MKRLLWMPVFLIAACGTPSTTDSTTTDDTTDSGDTGGTTLTGADAILALTGDVATGKTLYESTTDGDCASCHGDDGKGGIGTDLTTRLPTITQKEAVTTILEGEGLMIAYDDLLEDQEIADINAYIWDEFGP